MAATAAVASSMATKALLRGQGLGRGRRRLRRLGRRLHLVGGIGRGLGRRRVGLRLAEVVVQVLGDVELEDVGQRHAKRPADVGRQELAAADLRLRLVGYVAPGPVAGHQAPAIAFADLDARFRRDTFGTVPARRTAVGGQGARRHNQSQEYGH